MITPFLTLRLEGEGRVGGLTDFPELGHDLFGLKVSKGDGA